MNITFAEYWVKCIYEYDTCRAMAFSNSWDSLRVV